MVEESIELLPCRILQMQVVCHPGDYNCGPHVQIFVLCENSTMWVRYHASGTKSNVPNDGRWRPVVKMVQG